MKNTVLTLYILLLITLTACTKKINTINKDFSNYYELDNKAFNLINSILCDNEYIIDNNKAQTDTSYHPDHMYDKEYINGIYYNSYMPDGILNISFVDLNNDNINEIIVYRFKKSNSRNLNNIEMQNRSYYIDIYIDKTTKYELADSIELISLDTIELYSLDLLLHKDNDNMSIVFGSNNKNYDEYIFKESTIIKNGVKKYKDNTTVLCSIYNEVYGNYMNNTIYKEIIIRSKNNYNLDFDFINENYDLNQNNYKNIVLDLCLTNGNLFKKYIDFNYKSRFQYNKLIYCTNDNNSALKTKYDSIEIIDNYCNFEQSIVTLLCKKNTINLYYVLRFYTDTNTEEKARNVLKEIEIIYKNENEPNLKTILNNYHNQKYMSYCENKINDINSIRTINSYERFCNVEAIDSFIFGKHSINDKELDIEWIILKKENDRALIVSKYIIDGLIFGNNNEWDKSTIRTWLNEDFYNNSFSDKEKAYINETIINTKGPEYVKENYNVTTTDKIFLLSNEEINQYFDDYGSTNKLATSTCCKEVLDRITDESYYTKSFTNRISWFLRNPGQQPGLSNEETNTVLDYDTYVSNVDKRGYCTIYDCEVECNKKYGIRPAMWINIDS